MFRGPSNKGSVAALVTGLLVIAGGNGKPQDTTKIAGATQSKENSIGSDSLFSETARAAGIDFVHFNGMRGQLFMPEMVGSGAALIDCDNDGDLDLFIVQGNFLGPEKTLAGLLFEPKGRLSVGRLYRNDLSRQPNGA